jgi:hypothetical protein
MFGKAKKSEEMDNKRKCERVMINLAVDMEIKYTSEISAVAVGDKFEGTTVNFSHGGILLDEGLERFGTGGMLIQCKKEIPVFSKVNVRINIPLPGYSQEFVIEAFVVRTEYQFEDDVYYIAMSFNKIVEHDFTEAKLLSIRKMLNI